MHKLLLIIFLLPSLVIASDDQKQLNAELKLLAELVPWFSNSDSIKLNEVVLISPKQAKANKAMVVLEKHVVNVDGADVGVSKTGKDGTFGAGVFTLLDIDDDGKPDIVEYGFTTSEGVDGSVQDIGIDGEPDIKMYFDTSKRVEVWLKGAWRKLKKVNDIRFADIDGKWVKVVIENRRYRLNEF